MKKKERDKQNKTKQNKTETELKYNWTKLPRITEKSSMKWLGKADKQVYSKKKKKS